MCKADTNPRITASLLGQSTEYGFSEQNVNVNKNSTNPFVLGTSIADSEVSSKTIQVSVMRAKLAAERRLADLEEEHARQKKQREEKLLQAELELKIAEAELADEMAKQSGKQPLMTMRNVDPLERVQQWILDLQDPKGTYTSTRVTPLASVANQTTHHQVNIERQPSEVSYQQRSDELWLGTKSAESVEMLEITKSMKKMLARTASGDGLPKFDGNIKEWPLFINQYRLTTAAGEYSGIENVVRLNKCLSGKAREAVQHMLMASTDGEQIVQALELRFGRPELLLRSFIQEIKELPTISNWEAFIEFDGVVRNLSAGIKGLKHHIYNPELLCLLLQKLPQYQAMMWGQYVTEEMISEPTVTDFAKWVEQTAKYATSISHTLTAGGFIGAAVGQANSSSSFKSDGRKQESKKCLICHKDVHEIILCDVFKASDAKRRFQLAMEAKLCFCCLRSHSGRCDRRQQCPVEGCSRYHHQLLHKGESTAAQSVRTEFTSLNTMKSERSMFCQALLKIIPVRIRGPKGVAEVPALLDEGSSVTIIDADVADALGIAGYKKSLCCTLMSGLKRTDERSEVVEIEVAENTPSKPFFKLAGVRTIRNSNLNGQRIDANDLVSRFPYVKSVDLKYFNGSPPALLIGQLHVNVMKTTEIYQPDPAAPAISKCALGWTVHGPMITLEDYSQCGMINVCCEKK